MCLVKGCFIMIKSLQVDKEKSFIGLSFCGLDWTLIDVNQQSAV